MNNIDLASIFNALNMPNVFDKLIFGLFIRTTGKCETQLETEHCRSISLENKHSTQWSVFIFPGSENLEERVAETIRAYMEYGDHEESELIGKWPAISNWSVVECTSTLWTLSFASLPQPSRRMVIATCL